jgi:predicted transcriptional regulator
VRQEGRSFLEKIFGGDVKALVTHFVAETPLDAEQAEQLRQLLAAKKKRKEKQK